MGKECLLSLLLSFSWCQIIWHQVEICNGTSKILCNVLSTFKHCQAFLSERKKSGGCAFTLLIGEVWNEYGFICYSGGINCNITWLKWPHVYIYEVGSISM